MNEVPSAKNDDVEVVVMRSGGFAGLSREWLARATDRDAGELIDLVKRCPWPDVSPSTSEAPAGADRFTWHVHARCGHTPPQQASLAEGEVTDAWRALIDTVRAWDASPRD